MRRSFAATAAALLVLAGTGCAPDVVDPNGFVRSDASAAPPLTPVGVPPATGDAGNQLDGGVGPADGGVGPAPPTETGGAPVGACDLNGRWLVAQRVLATAIGQNQAAHSWFYYEITQQGAALVVSRGLHCGYAVVKKTSLAASVDSSGAWPAFLEKNSSTGRRGTFSKEGAGCRLSLDKEYVVRGANVAAYMDPAQALPGRTQQATAGTPGWEDWEGDGQPGISLKVSSSLASGTVYTCQRDWTRYDGVITGSATKLKVSITYGGEQVPLGRSTGSPQAIESGSSPSSDATQHYAWFHRLDAGEAAGSPAQICAAVRTLKDQLVPEAAQ